MREHELNTRVDTVLLSRRFLPSRRKRPMNAKISHYGLKEKVINTHLGARGIPTICLPSRYHLKYYVGESMLGGARVEGLIWQREIFG